MLPLIIGAAVGLGLGYLGYREGQRQYQRARGIMEGMRLPAMEFWDEVQKYGLRQALEKFGYSQIREILDQSYRMQVSSLLARQGRALALSGISPTRSQAMVSRLRTPLDVAYLQQMANLPFDMMQGLLALTREAGAQEYSRAAGLAQVEMMRPSLAQDLLSGLTAGVGVGASVYSSLKPPILTIPTQK